MAAGILTGALAAAVLATGGGAVPSAAHGPAGGGPGAAHAPAATDGYWTESTGRFAPAGGGHHAQHAPAAVTYDKGLVPVSARIAVGRHHDGDGTAVRLRVSGLRPGHTYGAHVHQKPCGADPDDAGGHYQHRVDPVQPSKNPDYANPHNEVWLDFTADRRGAAGTGARHDWGFRPGGARSVVLHDEPGTSGARVACFTVPFGKHRGDRTG
ncbi:superoxide dismutase family protein [Streptomyces sp. NPDC059786]|uniref:superoxide dismutase family protein n=1 Tax=Streptomyces sp. NPDC059786 TaxID=3346946 RepID=UPI003652E501